MTNFCIGALISIVYDSDGNHYCSSPPGLSLYANGQQFHHQKTLSAVNTTLPFNSTAAAARLAKSPRYDNVLVNPNAPWGLPNATANDVMNLNGDYSHTPAWKMLDGMAWYDRIPDNRWTNNQTISAWSTVNVSLPRPRSFDSLSIAIFSDASGDTSADIAAGNVIDCPDAIYVLDKHTGEVVASRDTWDSCERNALNTVKFAKHVTTDALTIRLRDKRHYATAVSEIQIWVPASTGNRHEAEDGLPGTFIGGFTGRPAGMNDTVVPPSGGSDTNGGMLLGSGGWVELADVRSPSGSAKTSMTVLGAGEGTVDVCLNFLSNATASFDGSAPVGGMDRQNVTVQVPFLQGGNVVTMFQRSGEPLIDAIIVAD